MAIVVGLIVAFGIPKEYTTQVKLAPEMEDASKRMANLGGLAAIAGINLGAGAGSDAFSAEQAGLWCGLGLGFQSEHTTKKTG